MNSRPREECGADTCPPQARVFLQHVQGSLGHTCPQLHTLACHTLAGNPAFPWLWTSSPGKARYVEGKACGMCWEERACGAGDWTFLYVKRSKAWICEPRVKGGGSGLAQTALHGQGQCDAPSQLQRLHNGAASSENVLKRLWGCFPRNQPLVTGN